MWCGWFGGFGPNEAIQEHLQGRTVGDLRLVQSKIVIRLWCWIIPRPRMLFIYERQPENYEPVFR